LHAVRCRFFADGNDFPASLSVGGLLDPLNCAATGRVGRIPIRASGEVQASVAIDVVHCETDVVLFGQAFRDDMFLPIGVRQPQKTVLVCDHNIQPVVAVHIHELDGITNS
jgi:hypothetical protein